MKIEELYLHLMRSYFNTKSKNTVFKLIYFQIFIFIAFIFSGCITNVVYKFQLQEVETPKIVKELLSETKVVNFEDGELFKSSYEDTLIKIVWFPVSSQFRFTLQNKHDNSLKIIWDETYYIDENNISRKITHSDVNYYDRKKSQLPTVVLKGSTIEDLIMPSDNVYFVVNKNGTWRINPLFPNTIRNTNQLDALKTAHIGKTVKMLMSIMSQDIVNQYLFSK